MRRHLLPLTLLLITFALLPITDPPRADEKVAIPAEPLLFQDLVYSKPDANTQVLLDLARPCGKGPFPVVVYIHGGGWLMDGCKVEVQDDPNLAVYQGSASSRGSSSNWPIWSADCGTNTLRPVWVSRDASLRAERVQHYRATRSAPRTPRRG